MRKLLIGLGVVAVSALAVAAAAGAATTNSGLDSCVGLTDSIVTAGTVPVATFCTFTSNPNGAGVEWVGDTWSAQDPSHADWTSPADAIDWYSANGGSCAASCYTLLDTGVVHGRTVWRIATTSGSWLNSDTGSYETTNDPGSTWSPAPDAPPDPSSPAAYPLVAVTTSFADHVLSAVKTGAPIGGGVAALFAAFGIFRRVVAA
jgi:hypothetical protein